MSELIYFLHRDASLAAAALHDNATKLAIRDVGELISCALRKVMMSDDMQLWNKNDLTHPLMPWAIKSIEHITWLTSYYNVLVLKYKSVFKETHPGERVTQYFERYVDLFPRKGWEDPPQLMLTVQNKDYVAAYRAFYLLNTKSNQYNRVKPPFWFKDFKAVRDTALFAE